MSAYVGSSKNLKDLKDFLNYAGGAHAEGGLEGKRDLRGLQSDQEYELKLRIGFSPRDLKIGSSCEPFRGTEGGGAATHNLSRLWRLVTYGGPAGRRRTKITTIYRGTSLIRNRPSHRTRAPGIVLP